MLDEVFFELGVSSLIPRPMRIAELIEGDIFDSHFLRGAEPLIDEGCSSLDRIGCCICERDEVDRVIADIVYTSESCDGSSLTIYEPLSHFTWIK